jgi:transcription initiation factor IIE alpha subunit
METIVPLVRAVIRAFYTDEHAIVIEPLLRDPYFLEDDQLARGSLSRRFGHVASKRIRQLLDTLVEHSLVQKKEILVTIDLDLGNVDGSRHKRDFYYLDYAHLIKILTYRFHMISQFIFKSKREAIVPEWTCDPDCSDGLKYSLRDTVSLKIHPQSGKLLCPNCGAILIEVDQVGNNNATEDSYEGVNEKFRSQLTGEVDYRDGIQDLLHRAQNLGTDLPENDPAKRIKALDLASRAKKARLEGRMNNINLDDPDDAFNYSESIAGGRIDKEMPEWFQTTVSGEKTSDFMMDEKERKTKMPLFSTETGQDAYVLQYEKEMMNSVIQEESIPNLVVVVNKSINSGPVFVFKSGRKVYKNHGLSSDEWDELVDACPDDEYEAFASFFS